ncbi:uncharacterized protein LOC128186153 isoform X1 [Crassostrea angulata]|uniref:uncharacterized protein LOC128186153 isoform X1 n=2 Tax=Magallana angulata TaxID=2784310 RepID=UPI0022B08BB6|nr:uncharacterized protein LOC128186153 isoform X1 [Crassostrea angulata]XP_052711850.1 uncharacterized protein LOC128186153 isoform X1 [Crassostrea angulata]XP_052711851.1 uncharacterized protein LOC128186153 isoform X1 [Crassostrea angulata]XP_052711852.1 uncharacterized protein LOC128186153 isoform X1 [Crassostrea angulata]XP_052711853.1 uncharacterized protein LOC128186153 isoform X1 [Crassostrea angulata]XP_052711854.1 uncharacterized protein LOC128186153 isoform X1 [Crassostrea angulata]
MTSRRLVVLLFLIITTDSRCFADIKKRLMLESSSSVFTTTGVPTDKLCDECTLCKCRPHDLLDFACSSIIATDNYHFCENFICMHPITCSQDTSPTTKTTTTTTTPRLPVTCNKTSLIEAVAVNRPVTHPLVSPCSDPYYSPPEALTIKYCALPLASGWTKGQKVVDFCHSNGTLPYTPISTFSHGHHGEISGVFLHCTDKGGFIMIAQSCTATPSVMDVNTAHDSLYHLQDFHFILI